MNRARGDTTRLLVLVTANALAAGLLTFGLPWIALELGYPVSGAAALIVIFDVVYTATLVPSGAASDRAGHRAVLRAVLGAETVAAVVVMAAVVTGHDSLVLVVGLSVVLGAGTSFVITSAYGSTAAEVGSERLPLAYAHLTVGRQIGIFGGPALGGVIYAIGGLHALVTAIACSCGVALLMAATLAGQYHTHVQGVSPVPWRRRIALITSERHIRRLLLAGFVWNLPAGAALILSVPLLRAHLHLSSLATGAVLGAGAVGSISVALMMRMLGPHVNLTRLLVFAMAAQGVLLVAVGNIASLPVLVPVFGLMMLCNTTVASTVLTARSRHVAVHHQATIIGVGMFVNLLGYTIGGGLGALLTKVLDMPAIYAALGGALLVWSLVLSRLLRVERQAQLSTLEPAI